MATCNSRATQNLPGAGKSSYDLIDPGTLWAELDLAQGITFLDLGCGQGNYALAAADASSARPAWSMPWTSGKRGLPPSRSGRPGRAGPTSRPWWRRRARFPWTTVSVDVGFMATVLHDLVEAGTAAGALAELARVIKPGGLLAIVEFDKIDGPPGPPRHIRLDAGGSGSPGGPLRVCPAEDREARAVQLLDDVCEIVEAGFSVKISNPPKSPFAKGDLRSTPLWQRGAGGIFHCRGEPPWAHARLACARTGWKAGATKGFK